MGYIEKFEKIEKASELHLKGYKFTEIGRELGISPAQAKSLVDEYKTFIRERAENDPDLLDRLTENTMEMLDHVEMISREIWLTYEKAKEFEMVNQQNATLKNAMDIAERKAKLLQLMGAKVDSGSTARMQRAERVNEIVSSVIKEIVADCPRCRVEAQIRLAEAFKLMDKEEEAAELREIARPQEPEEDEFIDADSDEIDHESMMSDILTDD